MTRPADPADLQFAIDVVAEAGAYTLKHFRSNELEIIRKSDGSPVTAIDQGAEQLMRDRILAKYPDDSIMGEEADDVQGTSGRRWVIDPIDGTESFTHGVALYSNLLYLEDDEGPSVGIINIPALDEMVWAGRGLGCFLNGVPCSVSDHSTVANAVLSTSGFEYWQADMLQRAGTSAFHLRTWGDGYGYVLVASGRIEAMVDPTIKFWDIAPCQVIIPEAGGVISTVNGDPAAELTSCIATNGRIHDELVEILTGSPSAYPSNRQ